MTMQIGEEAEGLLGNFNGQQGNRNPQFQGQNRQNRLWGNQDGQGRGYNNRNNDNQGQHGCGWGGYYNSNRGQQNNYQGRGQG